jgi:hypothetical protein
MQAIEYGDEVVVFTRKIFGDRTGAACRLINRAISRAAWAIRTGPANFISERWRHSARRVIPGRTGRSLTDLAYIDCAQGDYLAGTARRREALHIFAGLGHRRGIARALEGSACLALAQGYAERALKFAGAAGRLRESISAPLHREEKFNFDQALAPAWALLGEAEGRRAWNEGLSMGVENALEYSLAEARSV